MRQVARPLNLRSLNEYKMQLAILCYTLMLLSRTLCWCPVCWCWGLYSTHPWGRNHQWLVAWPMRGSRLWSLYPVRQCGVTLIAGVDLCKQWKWDVWCPPGHYWLFTSRSALLGQRWSLPPPLPTHREYSWLTLHICVTCIPESSRWGWGGRGVNFSI